MLGTSVYRLVATATEDFSVDMLDTRGFSGLCRDALDETGRWHQRNCPLKAPLVIWLVVMMGLRRSLSIPNVLRQVMRMLRSKEVDLPLLPVTGEAVCHARKRLGVEPLKLLFGKLAGGVDPAPSFHGLRVWAVDGVHLTVPDTPANEAAFGRPRGSRGDSAYPQISAVALVDTESHGIKDVALGGATDAERPRGKKLIENLGSRDLALMDNGFAAIWMFERRESKDAHFLCRIPAGWKPNVVGMLGSGDYLVDVTGRVDLPPQEQQKQGRKTRQVRLRLRLIQYRIRRGEVIRVITSLLDPQLYPAKELAALYYARWECELAYDELETHLVAVTHGAQHTFFRSKTPDGVRQEAYGVFIAHNLVRDLMKEAAEAHDIGPLEISFVESLEVIRMALADFTKVSQEEQPRFVDQLLADIADCRLDRPRRNRVYPRKVKRKMSNFGLKRAEHQQVRCNYRQMLALTDQGIELPRQDESQKAPHPRTSSNHPVTGSTFSTVTSIIGRVRRTVNSLVEQALAA